MEYIKIFALFMSLISSPKIFMFAFSNPKYTDLDFSNLLIWALSLTIYISL